MIGGQTSFMLARRKKHNKLLVAKRFLIRLFGGWKSNRGFACNSRNFNFPTFNAEFAGSGRISWPIHIKLLKSNPWVWEMAGSAENVRLSESAGSQKFPQPTWTKQTIFNETYAHYYNNLFLDTLKHMLSYQRFWKEWRNFLRKAHDAILFRAFRRITTFRG